MSRKSFYFEDRSSGMEGVVLAKENVWKTSTPKVRSYFETLRVQYITPDCVTKCSHKFVKFMIAAYYTLEQSLGPISPHQSVYEGENLYTHRG